VTGPVIDHASSDLELIREVHRLVDQFVRAVEDRHGPIPSLSAAGWWTAPPIARLATVLVLGEAWIVHDPDRAAAERLRQLSWDLSAAYDWTAASRRPSHAELERRRAEPGPLARLKFDAEAARRWVETGAA